MSKPTDTLEPCPNLFELGVVAATPGALQLAEELEITLLQLLRRHAVGDWGELSADDWQANEAALRSGARLFSSYHVSQDARLWIITDAATDACGACVTGRGLCPDGGSWEQGIHYLDGPLHRLTTTILLPEDY
jgi:hypothetical protein